MQQFPLTDLFIDLFEFAVHVSGDKLVHLQEHFLTVYTALVQCNDVAAKDGRVCRPKHVEQIQIDQYKDQ